MQRAISIVPRAAIALRTTSAAAAGFATGGKSLGEKAKEAYRVSKEHVKAAVTNQRTGMQDVKEGRATVGQVASQHGEEVKRDIKQWSAELDQATDTDAPPVESASVRELDNMAAGQLPRDRVVEKPIQKPGE